MSLGSAKAYLERLKTNKEFTRQVAECKDEETRMAFVKEAGYDFTAAEIEETYAALHDDELAAISGGQSNDANNSNIVIFQAKTTQF